MNRSCPVCRMSARTALCGACTRRLPDRIGLLLAEAWHTRTTARARYEEALALALLWCRNN